MSATSVTVIAGLLITTVAIRSAGPVALGGRELPRRVTLLLGGLAPAVLASLIVFGAASDSPTGVAFDARLPGMAAAALAVVLRAPLLVVLLAAAGVTAAGRALGMA